LPGGKTGGAGLQGKSSRWSIALGVVTNLILAFSNGSLAVIIGRSPSRACNLASRSAGAGGRSPGSLPEKLKSLAQGLGCANAVGDMRGVCQERYGRRRRHAGVQASRPDSGRGSDLDGGPCIGAVAPSQRQRRGGGVGGGVFCGGVGRDDSREGEMPTGSGGSGTRGPHAASASGSINVSGCRRNWSSVWTNVRRRGVKGVRSHCDHGARLQGRWPLCTRAGGEACRRGKSKQSGRRGGSACRRVRWAYPFRCNC